MRKIKSVLISMFALTTLLCSCQNPVGGDTNFDGYYSSISSSWEGEDLRTGLYNINVDHTYKTDASGKVVSTLYGYANMRYIFNVTDADPNGSGKIVGFYDNKLVGPTWDQGSTWNREHVWPASRTILGRGGDPLEDDLHMVRPTATTTNSDRGNNFFTGSGKSGSFDPGSRVAEYRGITARIIFYSAITDLRYKLVDLDNDSTSNHSMGKLSDLLKWNLEYLPKVADETSSLALKTEYYRNYRVEELQGNRNPFIDHPEYACKIWGRTNSDTKRICGIQ